MYVCMYVCVCVCVCVYIINIDIIIPNAQPGLGKTNPNTTVSVLTGRLHSTPLGQH